MYFRKNDLEDLLKSLSVIEYKRFDKYISMKNYRENPAFFQLLEAYRSSKSEFTFIDNMSSVQALTNAKRRLHTHLLNCLHECYQEKSTELIIHNLLSKVEILYERGLSQQSAVLLAKAYTLALTNEHYGIILQVLNWERKINLQLDLPKRSAKEIGMEEKKILEKYNQVIDLETVYSKIKEIKKRNGYASGKEKSALERIIAETPLLSAEHKPSSQRAKHYYHLIYSLYYHRILDVKKAYQHSKKLITPEMKHIPAEEYLEGVIEHIVYCMSLGYFQEMKNWLKFADDFIQQKGFARSIPFSSFIFYAQICYTMIMHIYTGDIANLLVTVKEAEYKLSLYESQLSKERKLVIYGNLRNAYVAVGDISKAEAITDHILKMEAHSLRRDVFNDILLGRAFFFLISGAYELITAAALSAYRQYLKVKDSENKTAGLKISSILMKCPNYENARIRKSVLTSIKKELVLYISIQKGLNNFHEGFTFYVLWIDNILENKPFHIVASNWYYEHQKTHNQN